ncbi:hypothetical protein HDC90_002938 [Pedobacter sp. AK013]|nr:hypothetical protein [Pedobacter sp. AK013]
MAVSVCPVGFLLNTIFNTVDLLSTQAEKSILKSVETFLSLKFCWPRDVQSSKRIHTVCRKVYKALGKILHVNGNSLYSLGDKSVALL